MTRALSRRAVIGGLGALSTGVALGRAGVARALPGAVAPASGAPRCFDDEMVEHLQTFDRLTAKSLGLDGLRSVVQAAHARAQCLFGFTLRGPTRTFLELTLMFGTRFYDDPQYPWAAENLRRDAPEMERAEGLYQETLRYQASISLWAEVRAGFRWMASASSTAGETGSGQGDVGNGEGDGDVGVLVQEAYRIFPEKCRYVGSEALTALVREACLAAAQHGLDCPAGRAQMVALFVAFGHGVAEDPVYPAFGAVLNDPLPREAELRAARLREVGRTWARRRLSGLIGL